MTMRSKYLYIVPTDPTLNPPPCFMKGHSFKLSSLNKTSMNKEEKQKESLATNVLHCDASDEQYMHAFTRLPSNHGGMLGHFILLRVFFFYDDAILFYWV